MSSNWTQQEVDEYLNRQARRRVDGMVTNKPYAPIPSPAPEPDWPLERKSVRSRQPNKTERSYMTMLSYEFPKSKIVFEAWTFHMSNGHAYTPDLFVFHEDGTILIVEVKARGKNGFRQASYGRAKLAFDQSMVEYPQFNYRWAEKQSGAWHTSDY